jgi:DNA repair exonuclease SbcCD ATPase subunit
MAETSERTDPDGDTDAEIETLIDSLAEAHESYESARERVSEIGESELEELAGAHDRARSLLDRYEDRATGSGDFEAFVRFQSEFTDHAESLPEDLPHRGAFERAAERFDKRRLSTTDFERARETLSEVRETVARLDERRIAHERYRDARRALLERRDALSDRIEELEQVQRYGQADLDAPVEELREPIVVYDEAIREEFGAFRREESARVVLDFLAATAAFPLVPFDQPPADLREYVEGSEAGTESIPELLTYSEYSDSKLDHYVESPRELKRYVATHRTYLANVDGEPLSIGWPPPPADELWWRARELLSVLGRFGSEEAIEKLRAVRALARKEERYEHLRGAARARTALDAETRERLASGEVDRDLQEAQAQRDRLEEALSTYPTA